MFAFPAFQVLTCDTVIHPDDRLVPELRQGSGDQCHRDERRAHAGSLRIADHINLLRLHVRHSHRLIEQVEYFGLVVLGHVSGQEAYGASG